jgi:hypothetical protein
MQCFCVRARECASEGWKDAVECGTGRKQPSKGPDDVTLGSLAYSWTSGN